MCSHRGASQGHLSPIKAQNSTCSYTTFTAGSSVTALRLGTAPPCVVSRASDRDFAKLDASDGGPDDGQTTHLGGKHLDLIGALAHPPGNRTQDVALFVRPASAAVAWLRTLSARRKASPHAHRSQ